VWVDGKKLNSYLLNCGDGLKRSPDGNKMPSKKQELMNLYRTCVEIQGREIVDDVLMFTYVDEDVPLTDVLDDSRTMNDCSKKEM
jgi:predicted RNA-binding protein